MPIPENSPELTPLHRLVAAAQIVVDTASNGPMAVKAVGKDQAMKMALRFLAATLDRVKGEAGIQMPPQAPERERVEPVILSMNTQS
jgi:hypothetical protein